MDRFLCKLIDELDLENFGISYEDLVPVACSLKCTGTSSFYKTEFTSGIMKYLKCLCPGEGTVEGYKNLQSRILLLLEIYISDIVEENKEFAKIRL
jgi:hypothetical protein